MNTTIISLLYDSSNLALATYNSYTLPAFHFPYLILSIYQFFRGKGTIISAILIHQFQRFAVLLQLLQALQRKKYIQILILSQVNPNFSYIQSH